MKGPWLTDYLGHMQVAASDACSFVEGLDQADFLEDKRTQTILHKLQRHMRTVLLRAQLSGVSSTSLSHFKNVALQAEQ